MVLPRSEEHLARCSEKEAALGAKAVGRERLPGASFGGVLERACF